MRFSAPILRLGLALLALGFSPLGCQAKIGDACQRSTDCSFTGERLCDLSNRVNDQGVRTPGGSGECTIEGCGRDTCPKEAACIKVYGSTFLTVTCDPEREDRAIERDGEVLPPRDDCGPHEVCLPEGLCADEITARMSCRRTCKKDSDCRNGYQCAWTGWGGVYPAPDLENPSNESQTRICVPMG